MAQPERLTERVVVRVSKQTKRDLARLAAGKGRQPSDEVRDAVQRRIAAWKRKGGP